MAQPPVSDRPEWLFVELALQRGLIAPDQAEKVIGDVRAARGTADPLVYAQELIRQRLISPGDLAALYGDADLALHCCSACGERVRLADLDHGECPNCRSQLDASAEASVDLSAIEILSCPTVQDLALPLPVITPGDAVPSAPRETKSGRHVEPRAADADRAAARLARFEVEGELGQGGVGLVLKANDPDLDRTVAIKVLRAGPGVTPNSIARFHREAKLLARLNHPNIVGVHEVGNARDLSFIVQEFVEGEPLTELLARKGRLGVVETSRLGLTALDAIGYAHDNGVVHRDISPHNIMLGRGGVVKLIDFGLGLDADSTTDHGVTRPGSMVGTPHFMSPEQVMSPHEVDSRSDLFSIAMVLYTCLTGRPPFLGESLVEIVTKIVQEDAPPPSVYRSEIPPDLDEVILRALRRDRTERYATAEEFAASLNPFIGPMAGTPGFLSALGGPGATPGWVTPLGEAPPGSTPQGVAALPLHEDAGAPVPTPGPLPSYAEGAATPPQSSPVAEIADDRADGATERGDSWARLAAAGEVFPTPGGSEPVVEPDDDQSDPDRPSAGRMRRATRRGGVSGRSASRRRASGRIKKARRSGEFAAPGEKRKSGEFAAPNQKRRSGEHAAPKTSGAGLRPASSERLRQPSSGALRSPSGRLRPDSSSGAKRPSGKVPQPTRRISMADRRGVSWPLPVALVVAVVGGLVGLNFLLSSGDPEGDGASTRAPTPGEGTGVEGGQPVEGGGAEGGGVEGGDPGGGAGTEGGAEGAGSGGGTTVVDEGGGGGTEGGADPKPVPTGPTPETRDRLARADQELLAALTFRADGSDELCGAKLDLAIAHAEAAREGGLETDGALALIRILLEGRDDPEAARAVYESLTGSGEAVGAFARARLALLRGDGAGALVDARAAAEKLPGRPMIDLTVGEALILSGRAAEADRVLRPIISKHEHLSLPRLALARACLAQGEAKRATSYLDTLARGAPRPARVLALRALGDLLQGNRGRAQGQAEDALDLDPECVEARLARAMVHLAAGRTERALPDLDAALERRPDDLVARRTRAWARALAGSFAEAETDARRVTDAAPGDGLALLIRAAIARRQGRLGEALELAGRAASRPGVDRAGVDAIRAATLFDRGEPDQAFAAADQLVGARPDSVLGLIVRGTVLARKGQAAAALEAIENAMDADRRSAFPMLARGNLELRSGRVDEARRYYDRALDADDELAEARFGRALAWLRRDELPEARDDLAAFAAARPGTAAGALAARLGESVEVGSSRLATVTTDASTLRENDAVIVGFEAAKIEPTGKDAFVLTLELTVRAVEGEGRAPFLAVFLALDAKVARPVYSGNPLQPETISFRFTVPKHRLKEDAPVSLVLIAAEEAEGVSTGDATRLQRKVEFELETGKEMGVTVAEISEPGTALEPLDALPDPLEGIDPVSLGIGASD